MAEKDPLKQAKMFAMNAQEFLQNNENVVLGYYLKQYAIKLTHDLFIQYQSTGQNTMEVQQLLNQWLNEHEQTKIQIQSQLNKDINKTYIQDYALDLFLQADNQEREGQADKETMHKFQYAARFFEVLTLFGPLDSDLMDKKKYAKVKMVEILRMIKNPELYQKYKAEKQNQQKANNMDNFNFQNINQSLPTQQISNQNQEQFQKQQEQVDQKQLQQFSNMYYSQNKNPPQQNANIDYLIQFSAGNQQQFANDLLEYAISELEFKNDQQAIQLLNKAKLLIQQWI